MILFEKNIYSHQLIFDLNKQNIVINFEHFEFLKFKKLNEVNIRQIFDKSY